MPLPVCYLSVALPFFDFRLRHDGVNDEKLETLAWMVVACMSDNNKNGKIAGTGGWREEKIRGRERVRLRRLHMNMESCVLPLFMLTTSCVEPGYFELAMATREAGYLRETRVCLTLA